MHAHNVTIFINLHFVVYTKFLCSVNTPITAGKQINVSFLPYPVQRLQHAMRSATAPSGEDREVLQAKSPSALWSTAVLLAATRCPNAPLSHRDTLQLKWPGVLGEIKCTITLIHTDRHFQVKGDDKNHSHAGPYCGWFVDAYAVMRLQYCQDQLWIMWPHISRDNHLNIPLENKGMCFLSFTQCRSKGTADVTVIVNKISHNLDELLVTYKTW